MSHYSPLGCNCCTKHGFSKLPRENIIKTMKLQNKIINCYSAGGAAEEKLSSLSEELRDFIPTESTSTLSGPNLKTYLCLFFFKYLFSNHCTEWMNLNTPASCFSVDDET